MSSDWPLMKISDVAYYRNNKRVPLKNLDREKRQGIYPYYGASGIVDYIDDYIFNGTFLLISEDGENLRARKTPIAFKAHGKFWVNNHAHILEEKEEGIVDYLEYYFSQLDLTPYITGAVQPKLNKANLDMIEIRIPPLNKRKAINRVLNSLNNKIKINQKVNQTLEQIAQAIFKSWFVDFEPVKAKINALATGGSEEDALLAAMQTISGKDKAQLTRLQTDSPEHYNQLRTTAELFPCAMQDSELGEIPEGWLLEPFSNIARLDTTSVKPAKEPEKIWEHYSIPAFDDGMSPAFDLGANIKSNKYRVFPESVLVSKLNPHFPRTWLPDVLDSNAAICSTEFMQFVPIKPSQRAFVAGIVKSDSFQNGIMMRVTGSTGSRQRAQPKQVAEMEVLLPSEELRNIYSVLIAPQLESQASNIREALNLADVRETLLPHLLSGQLSVHN